MSRTIALTRMRLFSYTKSQRIYPPLVAALVLILVAHGGGPSDPQQAYAFSAALLFAVFGWQTKTVLDTEPDTQRLLSRLAAGTSIRELGSGLLTAASASVPIIVIGLVVPLLIGFLGVGSGLDLAAWLGFGLWAHLMSALCGLAVGALASRAIVSGPGWAAMILVASFILVLAFGSRDAVIPRWLVPQLIGASWIDSLAAGVLITLHSLAWTALGLFVYARLRRSRP